MLIRQNSLIAIGDRDRSTDYDYANNVTYSFSTCKTVRMHVGGLQYQRASRA